MIGVSGKKKKKKKCTSDETLNETESSNGVWIVFQIEKLPTNNGAGGGSLSYFLANNQRRPRDSTANSFPTPRHLGKRTNFARTVKSHRK